jgi:hypothetical protein
MKIVKLPHNSYEIQSWFHGIGFKNDNFVGEKDSNGFFHAETGLFKWIDYRISYIYSGAEYDWIILRKISI